MNYKTFDDLEFYAAEMPLMVTLSQVSEWMAKPLERAHIIFDNGWGASVITGYGSWANEAGAYELATFYKDELHLDNIICKNNPVAPISKEEVSLFMKEIQDFKPLTTFEYEKLKIDNEIGRRQSAPFFW